MDQGAPRQSWFRRNWKWVLGTLLALGLLGAAIAVVTFNNSDATKLALATATSNSALIERLGQPIQSGWLIGGSIEVTPGSGKADLSIPISGPKGKGTVYALAVKTAGVWKLTLLQFGTDGDSNRLQLLQQ
jgi:Cytochrome oxidase complex assembly protein 1